MVSVQCLSTASQASRACGGMEGNVGDPAPTSARQGRHRQRYGAGGERLVAGCIPVRVTGNSTGPDGVEVLLVSSRAGKGFCLPKGGWEDDETVEAAAKRETVEEAGVRGVLEEPMLGVFHFQSGKQHQVDSIHQGKCIAHMYVMYVSEELEVWPESDERQRLWCPLAEAHHKCRHEWMRQALLVWVKRKGWQHILEACSTACDLATVPSDMSELSDAVEFSKSHFSSSSLIQPTS